MGRTDEHRLQERLARVTALERGATTPGERSAAAAARLRLSTRLDALRAKDPVRRFVAAHVHALGREPRPPEPPAELPTEAEILAVLRRWVVGDVSRWEVEHWAEAQADRHVLPTDPHHEHACIAEVLLQLAMLHRVAIGVQDVPAIEAFLVDRDWHAWFEVVAAAARRRRPRG